MPDFPQPFVESVKAVVAADPQAAVLAIAQAVAILNMHPSWLFYRICAVPRRVKDEQPLGARHPYLVSGNMLADVIDVEAVPGRRGAESLEIFAVEFVESVLCRKPDVAVPVLQNALHAVV